MDDFKNTDFDVTPENGNENFTEQASSDMNEAGANASGQPSDDIDMSTYESNYTNDGNWFADDFEQTIKNAVPKNRAISIYRPKEKKARKFFKQPAVVAVLSSLLTCAVCMSVFAFTYKPEITGSVLPPAPQTNGSEAVGNNGGGEIKNAVNFGNGAMSIPQVYDKASPAVVSILCQSQSNAYMQSQAAMSSGSGIIIRSDGYIVTNNHVVEGAAKINVTTIAGQSFEAELVGTDARTDLAVLKVKSDTALPYADLGDSSELKVGDLALAIGNPLREELAGTLTVGYISAINRSMVINGKQMTMIQTDAAINPGNSGGALLNDKGQVVGINTAKSTGYDVEGLGFAIPVNEAKPVIEAIIKDGYVTGRPIIGLGGQTVTEAISKANGIPIGVYVRTVTEFGAAERAGIRVGDVIIECEGQKVTTIDEINEIRDQHKAGDTITMKLNRNGKKIDVEVTLQEEKPETQQQPQQQQQQPQIPSDFFSWFGW